jgi:hypothetical protein
MTSLGGKPVVLRRRSSQKGQGSGCGVVASRQELPPWPKLPSRYAEACLSPALPDVPIVVFTHADFAEVKRFFKDQDRCAFFQKSDLLPTILPRWSPIWPGIAGGRFS